MTDCTTLFLSLYILSGILIHPMPIGSLCLWLQKKMEALFATEDTLPSAYVSIAHYVSARMNRKLTAAVDKRFSLCQIADWRWRGCGSGMMQQKKREGGEEEGEIQVKLKFKQKLLEEGGEEQEQEQEQEEEEIQVKMKLEPKMLEEEGEKEEGEEEGEDQEGDWLNC